jgi:uncharacterized protein (DUF433 family)
MRVISIDSEVMHGTPCFAGTRVPIAYVFGYLPDRLSELLDRYPTGTRQQVTELMRQMPQILAKLPPQALTSVT